MCSSDLVEGAHVDDAGIRGARVAQHVDRQHGHERLVDVHHVELLALQHPAHLAPNARVERDAHDGRVRRAVDRARRNRKRRVEEERAVLPLIVREFQEKNTLVKISADIIVQRESQKGILLGEGGRMIRQLGTLSREEIEKFIGRKVFLELLVKVQPKWRDSDRLLKEFGYL